MRIFFLFLSWGLGFAASQSNEVLIETNWKIDPSIAVAPTDWVAADRTPTRIDDQTFSVKAGDVAQTVAVVSGEAAVLSQDWSKGKKHQIPAGTYLFKVKSSNGSVFCSAWNRVNSTDKKFSKGWRRSSNYCFYDKGNDGRFDGVVRLYSLIDALPNFRFKVKAKQFWSAEFIEYDRKPISGLREPYRLGLVYTGSAPNSRTSVMNHHFKVMFGSASEKNFMTDQIVVRGEKLPASVDILGGKLTVVRQDGPQAITIKFDEGIPAQSFGVTRQLRYR